MDKRVIADPAAAAYRGSPAAESRSMARDRAVRVTHPAALRRLADS